MAARQTITRTRVTTRIRTRTRRTPTVRRPSNAAGGKNGVQLVENLCDAAQ